MGQVRTESLDSRRSNQSVLKEINLKYSLKELMLKLKLQYFDHLKQRANSLEEEKKTTITWERLKAKGEESAEDEMV